MIVESAQARVTLAPGQIARLQLRAGSRLHGVAGVAWITLDNDPRDIVLERREEWTLDKDARVLASALPDDGGAEIRIEEAQRVPLQPRGRPQAVTA